MPQWHRDIVKERQESQTAWLDWEQVKASLRESPKDESFRRSSTTVE
ncbi:MAG: hypothetical protein WCQ77_10835 [Planctomycetota bacterium]